MADVTTPVRLRRNPTVAGAPVTIPPSPFLKKLGYGSGVAVYKLERSPTANQVRSPWAIKKLIKNNIAKDASTRYGQRLKEEAGILRKLNHPHIVGFRAFVKNADNQDCLAMEECKDCLGDMIEKRNEMNLEAFPALQIMKVALDVSEALDYLHSQALLLHCDVKSYNVLIKDNFSICKLCDFGISMPLKPNGELDCVKAGEDAEFCGTRLWAAPEVVNYPQVITTKADVYSYGLVLWEMLALCPPCLDSNVDLSMCDTEEYMNRSFDDSISAAGFGKRPDLPPQDFDDSYKYVLEIFHCCTEENPVARPSAQDLTISIPEMIKELNSAEN